ncbi:MAG: HlyD family efflux transporter periplasmic adaptor subunit [Bacteroidota bacterium]
MDQTYTEKKLKPQLSKKLIGTGLVIIGLGFGVLFAIAYLLRYSDKVIGQITLTTAQMPLDHVAQSEGILVLLVEDKAVVKSNQLLAYIKRDAAYEKVVEVEKCLSEQAPLLARAKDILRRSEKDLGALGTNLLALEEAVDQYDNYLNSNPKAALISKKQQSIDLYKQRLVLLGQKSDLSNQDIELAEKQSASKKRLAGENIIAEAEFDRALQEKISKEFKQLDNEEAANAIQIYIAELEQEVLLLRSDYQEQSEQYKNQVKQAMNALKKAVQVWKDQYLIYANQSGQCSWSEYLAEGEYVQKGQKVCTVSPADTQVQVGKMEIAMNGAGKVKKGQEVNIFLANYPPSEFGILKGEVSEIAPLPENGILKIEIAVPEEARSTYGVLFDFQQLATGQAEIITNKMSFAERIWNEAKGVRLNE